MKEGIQNINISTHKKYINFKYYIELGLIAMPIVWGFGRQKHDYCKFKSSLLQNKEEEKEEEGGREGEKEGDILFPENGL